MRRTDGQTKEARKQGREDRKGVLAVCPLSLPRSSECAVTMHHRSLASFWLPAPESHDRIRLRVACLPGCLHAFLVASAAPYVLICCKRAGLCLPQCRKFTQTCQQTESRTNLRHPAPCFSCFWEFPLCNHFWMRMMIILHHFRGTAAAGDCGKRAEQRSSCFPSWPACARTRTFLLLLLSGVEKQLVERCGQI